MNRAEAVAPALSVPLREGGAEGESSGFDRFLLGSCLVLAADSDATDNFGSPPFERKMSSGTLAVEGDANEDPCSTMAELILHDQEPGIHFTSAEILNLASKQRAK